MPSTSIAPNVMVPVESGSVSAPATN
jgi:hypothetical protein